MRPSARRSCVGDDRGAERVNRWRGVIRLRTWSISACAAENRARRAPRAAMTAAAAAARWEEVLLEQARSTHQSQPCHRPSRCESPDRGSRCGCPDRELLHVFHSRAGFSARSERARFWSRRVIAIQRRPTRTPRVGAAQRQLVLHGLPTTTMRTLCAACCAIALPLLRRSVVLHDQVAALHSRPARQLPTSRTQSASLCDSARSELAVTRREQRYARPQPLRRPWP